MSRKNKKLSQAESAESYSRESSTSKYMKARHRRVRRKVFAGIGIALVAFLFAGIGLAWAYVNNVNQRLTNGITQETRATLTDVAEGEPFYMLLLGIDKDEGRATSSQYGASDSNYRTDSIMIARIDPTERKVTLISIHRDTQIELGSYGTQKINAAFTYGGAPYTIQTINEFAGIDISHYAEVDMDGLEAVVNAVGGIDIDLPIDVVDPRYTGLDLQAGEQHIDGHTAMLLCRARHAYDKYGDGDLYRAANQRIVIMAVIQKILASDPVTMASTVTAMAEMITTDFDVASIIALANQMRGLDVSTDVMTGMEPTEGLYENNTWYESVLQPQWDNMMERVRQGLDPYDGSSYDATIGVSAELSNGRDTGETPAQTTDTSSSSDESSSSYDSDYDSDYYSEDDYDYDEGY